MAEASVKLVLKLLAPNGLPTGAIACIASAVSVGALDNFSSPGWPFPPPCIPSSLSRFTQWPGQVAQAGGRVELPTEGIASLQHESLDDAVEYQPVVVTVPRVGCEVLDSLWALVGVQLDLDVSLAKQPGADNPQRGPTAAPIAPTPSPPSLRSTPFLRLHPPSVLLPHPLCLLALSASPAPLLPTDTSQTLTQLPRQRAHIPTHMRSAAPDAPQEGPDPAMPS